MAANMQSMFYVREKPWYGLGTMVAEAPDSIVALRLAGLDWNVIQKGIMTVDGRRTWVLAKLPCQYIVNGEEILQYLVFMLV